MRRSSKGIQTVPIKIEQRDSILQTEFTETAREVAQAPKMKETSPDISFVDAEAIRSLSGNIQQILDKMEKSTGNERVELTHTSAEMTSKLLKVEDVVSSSRADTQNLYLQLEQVKEDLGKIVIGCSCIRNVEIEPVSKPNYATY